MAVEDVLSAVQPFRATIRMLHRQRVAGYARAEEKRRRMHPLNLRNFEQKVCSQNGEDGIILEIMNRVGATDKCFVEFGIGNGTECCTCNLLKSHSWSGLWIEGSPQDVKTAAEEFAGLPVNILNRFITRENIGAIFEEASVPNEPDLLVVDIDGNDYWIWQELAKAYSPRCLVMEYNASFTPSMEWVMPYSADHTWDRTHYYGASLLSLSRLAESQGYRLVACDSTGVNAFFVRADLIGDRFPDVDEGVAYHYVAPKFGDGFGHPGRPRRKTGK